MPISRSPHANASVKSRPIRIILLACVLLGLGGIEAFLFYKRSRYQNETARLRADMSAIERQRADAIIADEADRIDLMIQLIKRQAIGDDALHLAVSAESSYVALERGDVRLRVMPARFGPAQRVGIPPDTIQVTVPQGMRRVEQTVTEKDVFELPRWVWIDRQLPIPDNRGEPGWLGPDAIVTSGGTVLYAIPTAGPLSDSSYVMPGAVQLAKADLVAIRESITPGMRVYFY